MRFGEKEERRRRIINVYRFEPRSSNERLYCETALKCEVFNLRYETYSCVPLKTSHQSQENDETWGKEIGDVTSGKGVELCSAYCKAD